MIGLPAHYALQRRTVENREIELLVAGTQFVKQVKHLVDHPVGPRSLSINLVHHHNRVQTLIESFLRDEAGLGHRPFHGIHQQQDRVNHGQDPLDLSTEVGMTRRIDDVDAIPFPVDGGVFRQNRDAPLTLLIVRVHDPLHFFTPRLQRAGLLEQFVHQRGLSVIDVGNNGDVAK